MPLQMPETAKQMPHASKLDKHLLNLRTEKKIGDFLGSSVREIRIWKGIGWTYSANKHQLRWGQRLGYNFIFNMARKPSPTPGADYRESWAITLLIRDKTGCHKQWFLSSNGSSTRGHICWKSWRDCTRADRLACVQGSAYPCRSLGVSWMRALKHPARCWHILAQDSKRACECVGYPADAKQNSWLVRQ